MKRKIACVLLGMSIIITVFIAGINVIVIEAGGENGMSDPVFITDAPDKWIQSMSVGDYDGDGYDDIVYGTYGGDYSHLFICYGSAFGPQEPELLMNYTIEKAPQGIDALASGDFNGDGYEDISVGTFAPIGEVYIFYGSTTGLGIPHFLASYNFVIITMAAGDFNDDGYDDMTFGNVAPRGGLIRSSVYIAYGSPSGLGIPTLHLWGITNFGVIDMDVGDFNNDQFKDLVFVTYNSNLGPLTYVYHAYGSAGGLGTPAILATNNAGDIHCVSAGDYNNDTYDDIAYGTYLPNGRILTAHGSDAGLESPTMLFSTTEKGITEMAAGDYNNDGFLDLSFGTGDNGLIYLAWGNNIGLQVPSLHWDSDEMYITTVNSGDFDGNSKIEFSFGTLYNGYLYVCYSSGPIKATIDVDPDTINLKSKGKWITAYINLPEGSNVNDIEISTVMFEDVINAEWGRIQGDTLMVKFDRAAVKEILVPGIYNFKVSGEFTDGMKFEGLSDEIRVIEK